MLSIAILTPKALIMQKSGAPKYKNHKQDAKKKNTHKIISDPYCISYMHTYTYAYIST